MCKTSDMESERDASVLKLRTAHTRLNNCQQLEKENINTASSSSLKCFSTSENLKSSERVRKKKGKNSRKTYEDLFESDQQSKRERVAENESRKWLYNNAVREGFGAASDSHSDIEAPKSQATCLMKGICLEVEEERAELKMKKVKLERNVARLKTNFLNEGKWMEALKALQVVEINNLHAKMRANLKEVVAERDRLGNHLISKEYSVDGVDAIRANTYVGEEEDKEIEDVFVGIVDGLDGVSPQTVRDNQGDENERPEGENEKIKEKDAKIKKGKKELAELIEHAAKLERQNEVLMAKSRDADMVRYRIQALEKSKEGLNRSVTGLKNDLIKKTNNQEKIQTDLANSRNKLEQLKKKLVDKDNELKRTRDDLSVSKVVVD
ncbi:hypothetical protein GIB67_008548 [Kingdonia uniflora]|uniref:Uncharacterized protein n=1 Tax=Kingdonia uniflora TaxID=39325 RepID=A0A7J7N3U0_9MAGN|nr:hypothetical protein GIB67_008548 [Kingdonia uniflora]